MTPDRPTLRYGDDDGDVCPTCKQSIAATEPGLDVERLATFLHERICDKRAYHDAALGRCWEIAAEYARLTTPREGEEFRTYVGSDGREHGEF